MKYQRSLHWNWVNANINSYLLQHSTLLGACYRWWWWMTIYALYNFNGKFLNFETLQSETGKNFSCQTFNTRLLSVQQSSPTEPIYLPGSSNAHCACALDGNLENHFQKNSSIDGFLIAIFIAYYYLKGERWSERNSRPIFTSPILWSGSERNRR